MLTPARLLCSGCAGLFLFAASLAAAPQNVLVLGDSLSEEYAFELPFSAPDSNPIEANIRNWIEILAATRPTEISFGNYVGHVAYYKDYRDGGHAYNWAVPGFKTTDLVELINPPFVPDSAEELLDSLSCPRLKAQLKNEVAWAVIFCGGNDLSSLYAELCAGTATSAQLTAIRDNLAATIDFVRAQNNAVRIVLVNTPDIGVTPKVKDRAPDPAWRAVASAGIAALNALLAELATDRGIALADIFTVTCRLDEADPFLLNGTPFLNDGDPTRENRPQYLFAKDGFHASTAAQALIANAILQAMNTRYAAGFTLLTNRELIAATDLDPDQPYLYWLAAAGLPAGTATTADTDGDGVTLLSEFALGLSPTQPDTPVLRATPTTAPEIAASFVYPPDRSDGYALTTVEWTTDLAGSWQPVPTEWISAGPTANGVALPSTVGPRAFLRLRIAVAP